MSALSSDVNQASSEKVTTSSTTTSTAKIDKPQLASPLSELRNGKVFFKQKPLSFESLSETMQEIVKFRDFIASQGQKIVNIPDAHLPLIAKLVHESDKTAATLAKSLLSLFVCPVIESSSRPAVAESPIAPSAVEHAIKQVATRVNYGIIVDSDKNPPGLSVWRWEVNNMEWLPKSVREMAAQRSNDRLAAKNQLQMIFEGLSEEEKNACLGKNAKLKATELKVAVIGVSDSDPATRGETKGIDPEAVSKGKEKQDKKAVKAEKDRKAAEAHKKSATAFASFFKAGTSATSHKHSNSSQTQSSSGTTKPLSDYDATFKPFVVKKDAEMAPRNWFLAQRVKTVIELDEDGRQISTVDMGHSEIDRRDTELDISSLSPKEILQSHLNSNMPCLRRSSIIARKQDRRVQRRTVRSVIRELNDAEVHGDHQSVRKLTMLLKDRRIFPAKVFIFAENNKPGYLGTWTRTSSLIGPRTPFARDIAALDYEHDSDAEWEDEEAGDDVDSVEDALDDDEVSSVASDLADWLVDSDEIDMESLAAKEEGVTLPLINVPSKRKTTDDCEASSKKRRVVPLIPFQKGPSWENELGICGYEPFNAMRIQFFNDIPFPLDPFTFTTNPTLSVKDEQCSSKDAKFAVPALPNRHIAATEGLQEGLLVKRKTTIQTVPKTNFPEIHVPLLLQKIATCNTSSFVVLLDSVFQDLKSFGIRKNALETKLRELVEKDKSKKIWVVRNDLSTEHRVLKPT